MSGALSGRRIVVTRPAGQAESLADLIRAEGGTPIVFPVIEIRDVADVKPLTELIDRLDDFDIAVFISANAVAKAMNLVQSHRAWPERVRVATIGKGSEKALKRFGFTDIVAPTGRFDSEALLALAPLAERGLLEDLDVSFADEDHDTPDAPGGYGVGGWTEGDAAALIYDKFDIWVVPTDGASRNT